MKLRWKPLQGVLACSLGGVLCAQGARVGALAAGDETADPKPEPIRVYYGDPEVTLPDLLPARPLVPMKEKCKEKLEGKVKLSLIVDAQGASRNVYLVQAVGTDLDRLALAIASSDRFKAGELHGQAVAVGRMLEMRLQACVVRGNDGSGKKMNRIVLRAAAEQRFDDVAHAPEDVVLNANSDMPEGPGHLYHVGNGVEAPKAIFIREAEFSDYARKKKIEGVCVVSLIVDAQGIPQNIHISKHLEDSLDEKAIEAVAAYRFRPSIRNGRPVPVPISVEVRFRLY